MALELLHPSNPHLALDSYRTMLPFFASLQSELGLNVVPPSSHSVASDSLSTPSTLSSAPSSHPASQHHHYPHLGPSAVQLPMLAQAGGKPDLSLFVPLKELWRWVERLLWRAVVLTAQVCDIRIDDVPPSNSASDSQAGTSAQDTPPVSLWTYLAYYASSSAYWPPTFRSAHRTTVGMIHLRAFVLRYGPAGGSLLSSTNTSHPPTPTNARCSKSRPATGTSASGSTTSSSTPCRPPWITEALSIINTQRAILTTSTKFPRAGERNVPVEEFAELVVRVWEVWVAWSIGFWFADGAARDKGRWSDTEGVDPVWVIDVYLSNSRRDTNSNRYFIDPDLVTNTHIPLVACLAAFDTATIPFIGNASEQAAG